MVSLDNECKEVLFLCRKGAISEPVIHCVNLFSGKRENENFTFTFSQEKSAKSIFSHPLRYLYEPNTSILKAGAFKIIGEKSGLAKVHPHSHFYTSEKFCCRFPGRVFEIDARKPHPRKLKVIFPENRANILSRNYPLSPEQLKKKLKLEDGGNKYLIAFSGITEKFLIAATRLKKPLYSLTEFKAILESLQS